MFSLLLLAGCRPAPSAAATTTALIEPAATTGVPAATAGIPATTAGIPATTAAVPAATAAVPDAATGAAAAPMAKAPAAAKVPATPTPLPTAAPTPTPTATPTATPVGACAARVPSDDDLLVIVTLKHPISREYAPSDLVMLSDYLPQRITQGFPTELRAVAVEPLVRMIAAMEAAGLRPQVLSGYRSYAAQAIAWRKWNEQYPEHAHIISAPPGYSEHQLGTAVDFGSPELAGIVGEEEIEFHTYFYKTSEGKWLRENTHAFGFTLSYPLEAFEITGFYYEPWHFRYVGVATATMLYEQQVSLIEYQLAQTPLPCLP